MTKDELIAALEAATGPSRELDAELGALLPSPPEDNGAVVWWPYYTASIDAALTLVPEGMEIWITSRPADGKAPAEALVHLSRLVGDWRAYGPTIPLALCIAALRARP